VQSRVSGGKNTINYAFFDGSPKLFNDIFGVNLHEFEASIPKIEREFNEQITGKYRRPGRVSMLDRQGHDSFMYYGHYVTQRFMDALLGFDGAVFVG
jgi:prepilin-type processing-associated H-X9-DG protein